ncbi:50S ribosomal protein L3 glutamine methyltransferase [Saezia sanguinis]|uniref:50S ribosomal protein L3 glutamine methyltransferase n=1 Tax=Saezia sanguinis TaxID=1965230 RepID=A0A433SBN1_9BURK|nr:50S ribosomal protein L3 N(5)-glutamine methyltransferase [Saezia sanguinis]RUS66158.1 50S ribosomal protein L3 glutamine methyltransferase [Saezia sanguinis]
MHIGEYIQQTSERFTQAGLSYGHGTTNAFDEAVWLVLWRLGLPLDDLDSVQDRQLTPAQLAQLDATIQQRIETRTPAAYITREAWLQGVPFYVDERAIVPRSLIAEVLAEGLADPWLEVAVTTRDDTVPHILDVCTGNGSLAILAALAWPDAVVTATDISTDALAVAQMNLQRHQLEQRVSLLASDGLSAPAIKQHAPYDLILCNPPYVNARSMQELPPEYRAEPELALAGGADGMDFVRPFLQHVPALLSEEGFLVLEIGHERDYFEAAFPQLQPLWLATSAGADQVLLLTRQALLTPQ